MEQQELKSKIEAVLFTTAKTLQVKEIAEGKMEDLNCFTIDAAMRMVAGSARSMGITVQGEFPTNM